MPVETPTTPSPTGTGSTTAVGDPMVRSSGPTTARRLTGVVALGAIVAFGVLVSLAVGSKSIAWSTVLDSFLGFDDQLTDHLIVRELRLPRTVLAVLVGASLGIAGAVMQGVTRNPLADPGLLGVNAGAAFAVVLAIWAFGIASVSGLVWFAFVGAAVASVAVYLLGSAGRGGANPVRLALAGAALAALLFALTRAVTLLDQATLDQFRFWAVGSLAGRGPTSAARSLRSLPSGCCAPSAQPGSSTRWRWERRPRGRSGPGSAPPVRSACSRSRCCAGAAVAAAGPIGFVGLVVPHAVRAWFGPDQRWLLPASALAGAGLLLLADTLGRIVARPGEVQVGIMTAAIGGPFFVVLVRRARMAQL
jgi:iron complex transport system permease protein